MSHKQIKTGPQAGIQDMASLLKAAFSPASPRDDFRRQLIERSLALLAEESERVSVSASGRQEDARVNDIPDGLVERYRRQATHSHTNSISAAETHGDIAEDLELASAEAAQGRACFNAEASDLPTSRTFRPDAEPLNR